LRSEPEKKWSLSKRRKSRRRNASRRRVRELAERSQEQGGRSRREGARTSRKLSSDALRMRGPKARSGGLRTSPAREYFYRFRAGRDLSLVGRTKTTSAFGAILTEMKFAVASCQQYEYGYFTVCTVTGARWISTSSFISELQVKASSVPSLRVTAYCLGVSCCRFSSSVF
jgi:hypothetical protein